MEGKEIYVQIKYYLFGQFRFLFAANTKISCRKLISGTIMLPSIRPSVTRQDGGWTRGLGRGSLEELFSLEDN